MGSYKVRVRNTVCSTKLDFLLTKSSSETFQSRKVLLNTFWANIFDFIWLDSPSLGQLLLGTPLLLYAKRFN